MTLEAQVPLDSTQSLTRAITENLLPTWKSELEAEFSQNYFRNLMAFVAAEIKAGRTVFPDPKQVLRSFRELDLPKVRVVILGQDPYHGPGQAIGRAFAVPNDLRPKPPSLKNIFKELQADLNCSLENPQSDLGPWVEQGVLLLNTVMTVRATEAFSHRKQGWETFTDKVIGLLGNRMQPLVFILWGSSAQEKRTLIQNPNHKILASAHPSPLSASRGFLGSKPFSRCNEILSSDFQQPPVQWALISQS